MIKKYNYTYRQQLAEVLAEEQQVKTDLLKTKVSDTAQPSLFAVVKFLVQVLLQINNNNSIFVVITLLISL